MPKLTDPNPYETLDIEPNADKDTILNAFARKNRGTNQERRQARLAFDALRKVEERLLVDALLPIGLENDIAIEDILAKLDLDKVEIEDMFLSVDLEAILHEDFLSHSEAVVKSLFEEIPIPEEKLKLSHDYDGLDQFLEKWLG